MSEARGHFDVRTKPEATFEGGIGRSSVEKTFKGDLQGTSTGEMLAVRTKLGSAAYVLIEHVVATLEGQSGTFILQHYGRMDRGHPDLRVVVVPDSGTAALTGIDGEMSIDAANNHAYTLRYSLPNGP